MPAVMTAPPRKGRTVNKSATVDTDLFHPAPTIAPTSPAQHVKQSVDLSPSEKLKNECIGVRLNFNWYSTGRKVDKETKQKMADAAASTEEGFSASKRLMDSKHPVIKQANELKGRIDGCYKSMTVPLAAFAAGKGRPEPGVRLLPIDKVDDFDKRMQAFMPEIRKVEEDLNAALPDIKVMDQKRLKGVYRAEDYPDKVSIDLSWGYLNVEVPAALERLSPAIYAQQVSRFETRMEETYELATTTILEQFLAAVEDWTAVLGPVVRIYPPDGNSNVQYHGAEIRQRLEAGKHTVKISSGDAFVDSDVVVPEGMTSLLIRFYPDKSKTLKETVIGPFTGGEYADLQPSTAMNEKRTFKTTTISAMTDFLAQFRNISKVISPSNTLQEMIKTVETQIAKLPDADAVANELRSSATFRSDTHKLMKNISQQIAGEIETFKATTRRIDRGLMKKQEQ